jgi:hypothetical protein
VRARPLLSLALLAVPCLALSCAAATPATVQPALAPTEGAGPYRSVHIDTLTPGTLPRFEQGRRAWVEELRRANVTDGRGVFLQVDGTRFYNLRPFATFASFDTRVDAINAALARVPKEAAEQYDKASDESLVFPHTSEIWKLDDDLSFTPASGGLTEAMAAVGTLVLDDVRPDPASEERYWGARGEINKALAEARYPLTLRSFRCVYGAGHLATLVLAPSREALEAAPALADAVARARGRARADELVAAVASSIVHTESHAVVVRHDLTWP